MRGMECSFFFKPTCKKGIKRGRNTDCSTRQCGGYKSIFGIPNNTWKSFGHVIRKGDGMTKVEKKHVP